MANPPPSSFPSRPSSLPGRGRGSASALPVEALPGLVTARTLLRGPAATPAASPWSLPSLRGRLVELSGPMGAPLLTCALRLVRATQADGRPLAWLSSTTSSFFPADAQDAGVDLARLPVVRLPTASSLARAADVLLRAAAFDLLVLDLAGDWEPGGTPAPRLAAPLVARLAGLARQHDSAVLCLTHKSAQDSSLGPLVAIRAQAHMRGDHLTVTPLKDPHHGTTWHHREAVRGALGMC